MRQDTPPPSRWKRQDHPPQRHERGQMIQVGTATIQDALELVSVATNSCSSIQDARDAALLAAPHASAKQGDSPRECSLVCCNKVKLSPWKQVSMSLLRILHGSPLNALTRSLPPTSPPHPPPPPSLRDHSCMTHGDSP